MGYVKLKKTFSEQTSFSLEEFGICFSAVCNIFFPCRPSLFCSLIKKAHRPELHYTAACAQMQVRKNDKYADKNSSHAITETKSLIATNNTQLLATLTHYPPRRTFAESPNHFCLLRPTKMNRHRHRTNQTKNATPPNQDQSRMCSPHHRRPQNVPCASLQQR